MNAVQIFALETFLERNYFASDEEGTIASIGCASFSTYFTNSDEESYCFSLYIGDLVGYEFSLIVGLKQKLSPNVTQTGFINSKHVTIQVQPINESKRYSCSKRFNCFSKSIQRFISPPSS